jgi:hypothetical protein
MEGPQQIIGRCHPAGLGRQTPVGKSKLGKGYLEMAYRCRERSGTALDMKKTDAVAVVGKGLVYKLLVAVEGCSLKLFQECKQIAYGSMGILHHFFA